MHADYPAKEHQLASLVTVSSCIREIRSKHPTLTLTTTACSWSEELASFLAGFTQHLVRRRLPRQASAGWPGTTQLPREAVAPVATELISLALSAMYHKNGNLRVAAVETLTNLVYFAPQPVLRPVLQRFWEALEAANSVHQISSAIRNLSGASETAACSTQAQRVALHSPSVTAATLQSMQAATRITAHK